MTPCFLAAILLAPIPVLGQPKSDDSVAGLLHREDVQTELKLTDRQKKIWLELDPLPKPKRAATFQADPLVIPDPDIVEKKDFEREKKAWSILGPSQTLRLRELFVQRAGPRALLQSDVQFELELSEEQRDRVSQAKTKYVSTVHQLIDKLARTKSEIGRLDPKKVNDALAANDRRLADELDMVMTNEQRIHLEKMGGRKFTFLEREFK